MRVQVAEYRDVRSWLDLAAEVEWLFGDMLGGPDFYEALLRNVGRGTAFCVPISCLISSWATSVDVVQNGNMLRAEMSL